MQKGLSKAGYELTSEEIEDVIKSIGRPGALKIDYSQYLSAALDHSSLIDKDAMWMVFKYFDCDNSGFISRNNLRLALTKGGWAVDESELESLMSSKKDGIDFLAFSKLFTDESCTLSDSSCPSVYTKNRV